jgi:hypothetical protein
MFAKTKVSQSMIDAVNEVTKLDEASPIKEPTPTGMRVYGRNYGNSAKAKQDQTKSDLDKIKGPKDKEMKEAAKPDFLDLDGDKNEKESMKKAIADKGNKGVKEELKGDQHKIDANKNNKVDAHDFAILRGKKKVKESFSVRLAEKYKAMKEKKDVVMPEALEKSPAKNTDVADKSYLKDKPGSVKSDLKNLGRFLTGKKETNEEVEQIDEVSLKTASSAYAKRIGQNEPSSQDKAVQTIRQIAKKHGPSGVATAAKTAEKEAIKKAQQEEVELTEEQLDEMISEVLGKDATAGDWISDFVHSDNPKFAGKSKAERKKMALGAYYGKQNEATIAGLSGWKKIKGTDMQGNVKDKSGATHTPMSRAKDLARTAFKKVQDRTKLDK